MNSKTKLCKNCKFFTKDPYYPLFGDCSVFIIDSNFAGAGYDKYSDILIPNEELLGSIRLVSESFGCVKHRD